MMNIVFNRLNDNILYNILHASVSKEIKYDECYMR